MKNIKDKFHKFKYPILQEICKGIREVYSDTASSQWLCINCGTEQNSITCSICKSNDYLIPYNNFTKQLLESQDFFDNLDHNVKSQIIESIKARK